MQMCITFQSAKTYMKLVPSAKTLINQTLKVHVLWKNRPYLVHFWHSKTIPSLVQAFKTLSCYALPFLVLKVAKIGPYPS